MSDPYGRYRGQSRHELVATTGGLLYEVVAGQFGLAGIRRPRQLRRCTRCSSTSRDTVQGTDAQDSASPDSDGTGRTDGQFPHQSVRSMWRLQRKHRRSRAAATTASIHVSGTGILSRVLQGPRSSCRRPRGAESGTPRSGIPDGPAMHCRAIRRGVALPWLSGSATGWEARSVLPAT